MTKGDTMSRSMKISALTLLAAAGIASCDTPPDADLPQTPAATAEAATPTPPEATAAPGATAAAPTATDGVERKEQALGGFDSASCSAFFFSSCKTRDIAANSDHKVCVDTQSSFSTFEVFDIRGPRVYYSHTGVVPRLSVCIPGLFNRYFLKVSVGADPTTGRIFN
jgi:hypothetical protein